MNVKVLNSKARRLERAARKANPNQLRKMEREIKAAHRVWTATTHES